MLAPAGTPGEILDFLNAQMTKVMHTPDMEARMKHDGLVVVAGTRAQFAGHIRVELDKWARVIRASGASVD
jgi:tripartite-type tricarboxylate transporter receptor subunit TctC